MHTQTLAKVLDLVISNVNYKGLLSFLPLVDVLVQVRDGKVKALTPREAGFAIQLSNKTGLDVHPSTERKKAWVKGSTWIPIFDVDDSLDAGTLSRKITEFMMGGWWSGVPTLSYDKQFLSKIVEKFPKDTDLIVACQKGLRSLAACELLHNAGYENLFWVQGGLEAAEEEDLEREGPQPFKLAGIGGLSEFLGLDRSTESCSCQGGLGLPISFLCPFGWTLSCCGCIVSGSTTSGPLSPGLEISLKGGG